MRQKTPPKTSGEAPLSREEKTLARRNAILEAALEEFAANGFSLAKVEDIARKAGVAKGTIYIHFSDKNELFEKMIRHVLGPVLQGVAGNMAEIKGGGREALLYFYDSVLAVIKIPRYVTVLRLLISEGLRDPSLVAFYHRDMISPVLEKIRQFLQEEGNQGRLADKAIAEVPQIIAAPLLTSILWNGLFGQIEPLDAGKLLHSQLDLIFRP